MLDQIDWLPPRKDKHEASELMRGNGIVPKLRESCAGLRQAHCHQRGTQRRRDLSGHPWGCGRHRVHL